MFIAEQSHQQKPYYESDLAVVTRDMRSEVNSLRDKLRVAIGALHDTSVEALSLRIAVALDALSWNRSFAAVVLTGRYPGV